MATLQKIRNNAGLLVSIFIGFALLAFILGDLIRSGDSIMNKSKMEVAVIDGDAISIQVYQQMVEQNTEAFKKNSKNASMDEATIDKIQEQTWDELIRGQIMNQEYENLGVVVTGPELFDMVQGNNIDPQILQIPIFKNPETGQFDRSRVVQFLKQMDQDPSGEMLESWSQFENALIKQKIATKYNDLIAKGLYITSFQAKVSSTNKLKSVDFDYVKVPFFSIADSTISVSQSEIEDYYTDNSDDYKEEEAREINYVVFNIDATNEDITATGDLLSDLKEEFANVDNAEQYVNLNSDVPFFGQYLGVDELSENLISLYESEAGTVYGPYREGDQFKLTKVVEFKYIPDSAKARHILFSTENAPYAALKATADSLLKVIKSGGNFAEIAKKYSDDGSASDGGDLGWFKEGRMVKPFNDACFFGKKGDISIVESQFGIHIIEVTGQAKSSKKVKLATIVRNIEPSQETYDLRFAEASKFGGSNRTSDAFKEAAAKENLNLRFVSLNRDDKNISNLESSRQIVKWAYEAEEGSVSEIFELDEMYIVATVSKVIEEGVSSLASVRNLVENKILLEKKANMLSDKIKAISANTLQNIADEFKTSVAEASNISLASYSIPGLGSEPEVQGYALSSAENKISDPIKGKTGVFVIKVKKVKDVPENTTFDYEKMSLSMTLNRRVAFELFDAMKEAKNVEDNRYRFY